MRNLKDPLSKEAVDKLKQCYAVCLTIGSIIIGFLLFQTWPFWISLITGFIISGVCIVLCYFLLSKVNKQLLKRIAGVILLCLLLSTPLFVVSTTLSHQKFAQDLQNPDTINYFNNLLDGSYNYTELIGWERQQLEFSGELRSSDPIKIYENQQGKCGEYAILYAALCVSQGYKCRIVSNVFNDHVFNEVLLSNGTWTRVDPSLHHKSLDPTGDGSVGNPMFFEEGEGWMPPILSLAFENDTITEVTNTYRKDGFRMLTPTTIIVTVSLFMVLLYVIITKLFLPPKLAALHAQTKNQQ